MSNKLIRYGFIGAGLINIVAVLGFSRFFSSNAIPETDPDVMSRFGLLMIIVWGLVFLGASTCYRNIKWIIPAFIVEKLVYVIAWVRWISTHNINEVYNKDLMAGIFYSVYGINDLLFFLFFGYVFYKLHFMQKE